MLTTTKSLIGIIKIEDLKSNLDHNHEIYYRRDQYIQMSDMLNMNDQDIYNLRAIHNTLYPVDNPANKI